MNERNALKTITLVLNDELKCLTRMFDRTDVPTLVQLQIENIKDSIRYIDSKTIELNTREYPHEMSIQPESSFVSDN